MKIINLGNLNTNVKCSFCGCEYEFCGSDVFDEYDVSCNLNPTIGLIPRRKYVYCPICRTKEYIKLNKGEEKNE